MAFKKTQGAIEFVIIFSAFLLFFVAFFSIIKMNMADKDLENERLIAQNVALDVQSEINLAAASSDGYYREFTVPQNIFGAEYEINVTDNRVFVFIDDFSISYKVNNVTGLLRKGPNVIKRENGTVQLNQ